jgi:hypothetical protein
LAGLKLAQSIKKSVKLARRRQVISFNYSKWNGTQESIGFHEQNWQKGVLTGGIPCQTLKTL